MPELSDELRLVMYWLANEDLYTSDSVRIWMDRNPPETVADDLARLAANAQPEPRSFWYGLFRGFMMAFGTSDAVSEKGPGGRKAGVRAALLLARMGDLRSLPPLVRAFETHWNRKGKYQDSIERALLGLVENSTGMPETRAYAQDTAMLLERIWRSGGTDLSPQSADLAIAAVRALAASENDHARRILHEIAASKSSSPNKMRVREVRNERAVGIR